MSLRFFPLILSSFAQVAYSTREVWEQVFFLTQYAKNITRHDVMHMDTNERLWWIDSLVDKITREAAERTAAQKEAEQKAKVGAASQGRPGDGPNIIPG